MPTRVESHYCKDKLLFDLTHKSKNLYNCANYLVRQKFIFSSRDVEKGNKEHAIWIS